MKLENFVPDLNTKLSLHGRISIHTSIECNYVSEIPLLQRIL